jgi:hypothetical protein
MLLAEKGVACNAKSQVSHPSIDPKPSRLFLLPVTFVTLARLGRLLGFLPMIGRL